MYVWGMEKMIEQNFMEWHKQQDYVLGSAAPIAANAKADALLTEKYVHETANPN